MILRTFPVQVNFSNELESRGMRVCNILPKITVSIEIPLSHGARIHKDRRFKSDRFVVWRDGPGGCTLSRKAGAAINKECLHVHMYDEEGVRPITTTFHPNGTINRAKKVQFA